MVISKRKDRNEMMPEVDLIASMVLHAIIVQSPYEPESLKAKGCRTCMRPEVLMRIAC